MSEREYVQPLEGIPAPSGDRERKVVHYRFGPPLFLDLDIEVRKGWILESVVALPTYGWVGYYVKGM